MFLLCSGLLELISKKSDQNCFFREHENTTAVECDFETMSIAVAVKAMIAHALTIF